MLHVQQLAVKRDQQLVLSVEELTFNPGEVVVLLGPNGAGKSSLLQTLSGSLPFTQGDICIGQRPLHHWPLQQRAQIMAVLSQKNNIPFPLSILEVVLLGRIPHATPQVENIAIACECLKMVDIHYEPERAYDKLSGGEQQRVQIARVLAQLMGTDSTMPRYLLLDEPTAALDLAHQHMVLNLLRTLAAQNVAVITVLHDLNLAMQYADRAVLLHHGKLVTQGHPTSILQAQQIQQVFDLTVLVISHPQDSDKKIIVPL